MKIALSCSMRFKDVLNEVIGELTNLGLEPLFPNLEPLSSGEKVDVSLTEKERLARDHYAAIDGADVVYFIVPEGYMGTSCKLELGYAFAKGKSIYFSEATGDPALDWYANEVIATKGLVHLLEVQK